MSGATFFVATSTDWTTASNSPLPTTSFGMPGSPFRQMTRVFFSGPPGAHDHPPSVPLVAGRDTGLFGPFHNPLSELENRTPLFRVEATPPYGEIVL